MLIECTIPEIDNILKVDQTTYRFIRISGDRKTPMLCDVVNDTHAAEILQMPGFKKPDDADAKPTGPDITDPGKFADMTYDELRAAYQMRFGRAAHPQAKFETLLAKMLDSQPDKPEADDSKE